MRLVATVAARLLIYLAAAAAECVSISIVPKFKAEESNGEFIVHDEAMSYTFLSCFLRAHCTASSFSCQHARVLDSTYMCVCVCMPPISGGLITYAIAQHCTHIASMVFFA